MAAFENSREFLSLTSQRHNNIKAPKATATLYPEPQGGRAFTPSEKPRPLVISYDVPLSYGREVVADDLSTKAANTNIPDAVRGLQGTLNKRGYSNPALVLPHLKEDGEFGPRTLARLDEELLRGGSGSVIRDLNGLSAA